MERCHVYGAFCLVACAMLFCGCTEGRSPVQPTPAAVATALQEFRLSGWVSDTASREIGGQAAGSVDPSGVTAPFEGYLQYCPSTPAFTSGEYWECEGSIQCDSRHHQLTLVRR